MPVKIDIVILSYAKNEQLKSLTIQTIASLMSSEDVDKFQFNVLVIESESSLSPYQFEHSVTIYPNEKFGFNKYLNIGIKQTTNDFICFCNNDLIFHKGWATCIFDIMKRDDGIFSAAPYCPETHSRDGYPFKEEFSADQHIFSGWCFLIKRELIDAIGLFDEKYRFWYADADYLNTLKKYGFKNYMVTAAKVSHLGSRTSEMLPSQHYKRLTALPNAYFNYKWKHRNYLYYIFKKMYIQAMIIFNTKK